MDNGREQTQQEIAGRLLHALGICAKARGLVFGVPMICEALGVKGNKKPILVLEAAGNAENSEKKLSDKCAFYGVRLEKTGIDGETLARAVGKTGRLAAVALTDENLCRLVLGTLERNG